MPRKLFALLLLTHLAVGALMACLAVIVFFKRQPGTPSETSRVAAQGAAPLAMDFMDQHHELKGIILVVIDNDGGTGSLAMSRESSLSVKQLYEQTVGEAWYKLTHPEGTFTVMDHMPRPGEIGNPHGEQHAL